MSKVVTVVGTGTIGEPLIGVLADHKEGLGIDEVIFVKRTPLVEERPKVNDLIGRGAKLAVWEDRVASFNELGMHVTYDYEEALDKAAVVIDCTPVGNENKRDYYQDAVNPLGYLAQGSEFGFGKMYARGINDSALVHGEDRFIHVVSCNTHAISAMINTLGMVDGESCLESGKFVLMRRANDISQDGSFVPSPTVGIHDDERFGTHHARDAHGLFGTLGHDLDIFSSAMKLNTQYMHGLHFSLRLTRDITVEETRELLWSNPWVAMTHKKSANQVFSFGRDHGIYGRLLSHAVVPNESVTVRGGNEVVGMAFTPQDGNSLLSSIAGTMWLLNPDPVSVTKRLDELRHYIFREI